MYYSNPLDNFIKRNTPDPDPDETARPGTDDYTGSREHARHVLGTQLDMLSDFTSALIERDDDDTADWLARLTYAMSNLGETLNNWDRQGMFGWPRTTGAPVEQVQNGEEVKASEF